MGFDDARNQFVRNRVLTATPAQRVVMLYDRLNLDVTHARSADDAFVSGQALMHAMQIIAELQASLDVTVGGPAANLSTLYTYLLGELVAARGGELDRLDAVADIVTTLRDAWCEAAELVSGTQRAIAAGSWVG